MHWEGAWLRAVRSSLAWLKDKDLVTPEAASWEDNWPLWHEMISLHPFTREGGRRFCTDVKPRLYKGKRGATAQRPWWCPIWTGH